MNKFTIDSKFFREIFTSSTGIKDDTISTLDHIFGSPPLRLIDSHSKLVRFDSATPILWDTTKPNIDKYRSELIMDMGFLSLKDNSIFLYNPNEFYCLSKTNDVNFNKQKNHIIKIFEHHLLSSLSKAQQSLYLNRVDGLIDIYSKLLIRSENNSSFYIKLLTELYNLIGFPNLASFISKKMISQFESGLIDKYIPNMILSTNVQVFGFKNLLEKTDLFKPPYFRLIIGTSNIDFSSKKDIIRNMDLIIQMLNEKRLLPHHTIYFWAWGLSGINHFGNDYGDYYQIDRTLNTIGAKNKIEKLQLTKQKEDGTNFALFTKTISFTPKISEVGLKYNLTQTKSSRASNLCSIFLNSGIKIVDYYREFKKTNSVVRLDMTRVT